MEPLQLFAGQNRLELSVSFETDASVQSFGDAYVMAKVQSNGFQGHNDLWIHHQSMRMFCAALVALERSLRGEALLESISPNELELKIMSVSSRGNVAVSGKLGYEIRDENSAHWHVLQFGFEFEQSQLSQAVALEWVQRYAV